MATEQRDDGVLYAVSGASRYGKSTWVKERIAQAVRVLVRDPRGEYLAEGYQCVKTVRELAGIMREVGRGEARLACWFDDADFQSWCQLAYSWGQLWPAVIVAEEIADVTSPGKAPIGWGGLIRKGLYYGNHIYSITQRPAECDKTVWGNATVIHTHGFILPTDQDYMALRIGCTREQVAALQPYQWLERWAGDPVLREGTTKAR